MGKLNRNNKIGGAKLWFLIWSLGLTGQICWNIENQWFNTFVYAKIGKDPSIITGMLIASAAATTFSTFFFGTWSDRIGKRRVFISAGYILWGLFTIVFGLTQFISPALYTFAGIMVVLADTVMSFFGSMGNDAAFNAWINDTMDDTNRGQIGAALATQPVLGTILGTVVGGFLVGSDDRYMRLFLVMGLLVIGFGILSFFMMSRNDDVPSSRRGTFWEQFFSVFNLKKLFGLRELLFVNLSVSVFFIGFNAYFAYMGNYIIYYLGFTADQMGIIEAVPLVLAMLTAIPISGLINRGKHLAVGVCGCVVNAAGLAILYTVSPEQINTGSLFNPILFLGILLVGIGYISFLQTTKIWVKRLYPEESRGQFEGIWILFFVLIPMIGGSLLGQFAVKHSGKTFLDTVSGQTQYIPDGSIFLYGLIFILLASVPLLLTNHKVKQKKF